MSLDFDPIYHTETMVRILREQGSTQHATELAESILKKNPQHTGVAQLHAELKEEARKSFERFRNSGKPDVVIESHPEEEVAKPEESIQSWEFISVVPKEDEVAVSPIPAQEVVEPAPSPPNQGKVSRLQKFLKRIQEYRKGNETSQA